MVCSSKAIVYHGSAVDREHIREEEFPYPDDKVENVAFNQRYLQKVSKNWRAKWEKTWMVDVVITTPEMLVCDDFAEMAAVTWEILVVDEAHRLKNHSSKLAQNLRDERFEFKHSLLLTGVSGILSILSVPHKNFIVLLPNCLLGAE